MGVLIRMGALIGIQLGRLLTKMHLKGGAYSEGGAYWKESTKSNHYGVLATSLPVAQWLECPTSVQKVMGSIPVGDSDFFFVPRSRHVEYSIFSSYYYYYY